MGLTKNLDIENFKEEISRFSVLINTFQNYILSIDLKTFPEKILTKEITSWELVRQKRDYLLSKSDWAMVPDAPTNKTLWCMYRQQLRDLPRTYESAKLEDIKWPEEPTNEEEE